MAGEVFHVGYTAGGAAAATLTFGAAATAGRVLVVAVLQTASTEPPTLKDNLGATWTRNAASAEGNTNKVHVYLFEKVAAGGEEKVEVTVGAGGTSQGLAYGEMSSGYVLDATSVHNNIAAAKTATSEPITTTSAESIVFAFAADVTTATGTITAWTGTGPMTNFGTTTARCWGGYLIPGSILTAATFTTNWTTEKTSEILVAAFKPEAAEAPPASLAMVI